jgi:FKBP-type peptidyl-prolyl cis-trans isomerase (trigger factor)
VLSQFAEAENISVEDADIDAEIETMASTSGEQSDMIRQLFGNESARDSLSRSLLTRKTLARLVEITSQASEEPAKKPAKQRRSAPRKAEELAEDASQDASNE